MPVEQLTEVVNDVVEKPRVPAIRRGDYTLEITPAYGGRDVFVHFYDCGSGGGHSLVILNSRKILVGERIAGAQDVIP